MANQIYVIRSLVGSGRAVKVGITHRAKSRLKQLKVGKQTELLALVTVNLNRKHEQRIHEELKPYRLPQSEWFDLDPDRRDQLVDHVKSLDGLAEVPEPPVTQQLPEPPAINQSPAPAAPVKRPPRPKRTPSEREQARIERERAKREREKAERKAQREEEERKRKRAEELATCRALMTAEERERFESFVSYWSGDAGDEDLTELEVSNPWIDWISRPDWDSLELASDGGVMHASLYISWFEPKEAGDRSDGSTAFAVLYPASTESPWKAEIDVVSDWMFQRYGRKPKSWEELEEWLWLLMALPGSNWPADVCTNDRRIQRRAAKLLAESAMW